MTILYVRSMWAVQELIDVRVFLCSLFFINGFKKGTEFLLWRTMVLTDPHSFVGNILEYLYIYSNYIP